MSGIMIGNNNYMSPYAGGYASASAGYSVSGQTSAISDARKTVQNPGESTEVRPGRKSSPAECETCKNRKYQDGSDEMVIKLVLTRRNTSEAFRYIKLAINAETKLIRRVEASTTKAEIFIFDFFDYSLNQDITDQRFIYDAPSSANNFNNFLFTE